MMPQRRRALVLEVRVDVRGGTHAVLQWIAFGCHRRAPAPADVRQEPTVP